MSIVLYGIKNCDTIKKAKKWLEAQSIDYRFHDYRVDGIDRALMDEFLTTQSWDVLLNKRGTTWRQLSDDIKNSIDEQKAIELMLEQPAMIKRPVMTTPISVMVGFKADQYQAIFATKSTVYGE
jgi:arsenate reductase